MQRKTVVKSTPHRGRTHALDARRLATVRGGGGLGIAVEVVAPPQLGMQMQHNETLIQL
jgi:hypothetical protein